MTNKINQELDWLPTFCKNGYHRYCILVFKIDLILNLELNLQTNRLVSKCQSTNQSIKTQAIHPSQELIQNPTKPCK